MAEVSSEMNLKDVGRMIADIPPRVFLMHNVHDQSGPIMVHTRWAMSYLRGPLTRQQVQILMADQRAQVARPQSPPPKLTPRPAPVYAAQFAAAQQSSAAYAPPSLPEFPTAPMNPVNPLDYTQSAPASPAAQSAVSGGRLPSGFTDRQPPVPSAIAQYFLPAGVSSQQAIAEWERKTNFTATAMGDVMLAYRPFLLAQVSVRYQDRKTQLYSTRQHAYLVSNVDQAGMVRWDEAETQPLDPRHLSSEPFSTALYGDLAPGVSDSKRMTALKREIVDVIYTTKSLQVPSNSTLGLYGSPDADFASFRSQLQQAARERRDAEMDTLTAKYEKRIDSIEDLQRRKLQRLENEKRELADLKREQLFTTGEAVLGLLKGRTAFTLSRMSRSAVYKQRSEGQLQMAELEVRQAEEEKAEAVKDYQDNVRAINERWAKVATTIEPYQITPYKKDITVDLFGIGWVPYWYVWINNQPLMLAALG